MENFMTPLQKERRKRDLEMCNEYNKLLKENPKASKTEVIKFLKKKYGFTSDGTFYRTVKRVKQNIY